MLYELVYVKPTAKSAAVSSFEYIFKIKILKNNSKKNINTILKNKTKKKF